MALWRDLLDELIEQLDRTQPVAPRLGALEPPPVAHVQFAVATILFSHKPTPDEQPLIDAVWAYYARLAERRSREECDDNRRNDR